jgi:hypothetical protein
MSLGLLPILWATGPGSEIMKRIAAPMIGGIFTSFVLELLVYPAIYALWRERAIRSEVIQESSFYGASSYRGLRGEAGPSAMAVVAEATLNSEK